MSKRFYKNKRTGSYGVLEGQVFSATTGIGSYAAYRLRLLIAVGGMVELSCMEESVTGEDLVEVSQNEVQRALLGL
jgi:hypothetical protein